MNTTHGPMRAHPLGRGSQGRAVPPPPDRPCSQSYDPALTLGLDRPYYIFPAHRDCLEPVNRTISFPSISNSMSLADPQFPSSNAFDLINASLSSSEANKKKYLQQANMVVQFNIKNKAGKTATWYLDAKSKGEAGKGAAPGKPDVVLILNDGDFKNLIDGKANAQKLFLSGKLKVKGNVMKAANLQTVLKSAKSKL